MRKYEKRMGWTVWCNHMKYSSTIEWYCLKTEVNWEHTSIFENSPVLSNPVLPWQLSWRLISLMMFIAVWYLSCLLMHDRLFLMCACACEELLVFILFMMLFCTVLFFSYIFLFFCGCCCYSFVWLSLFLF